MQPDASPLVAKRNVWEVGALVAEVAELLAGRFQSCTVRGEISGFSRAASGHCYFNLKDADGGTALLRCAMFRRAASLLAFTPADGQTVEVRGRLGIYDPRGELQFVAEAMQRAGTGALYEEFLRVKSRLEAQGLFDLARKRVLPRYPRTVGVVTSLAAAALRDVLTALARRAPHVQVVVYPCPVQGAAAPMAIAAAIATAAVRREVEVLILCRGGGSLEDLWSFNEEVVVRAIAASKVPVICGVGHESDLTLSDLAADLRAPTPTAAAELVAPMRQTSLVALDAIEQLMRRRLQHWIDTQSARLDRNAMRFARPAGSIGEQRHRLVLIEHRLIGQVARVLESRDEHMTRARVALHRAVRTQLAGHVGQLSNRADRLRALDPKQVLDRGYVWLVDGDNKALMSVTQVSAGDRLKAVMRDGSLGLLATDILATDSRPARR